jgi:hypothetical protein
MTDPDDEIAFLRRHAMRLTAIAELNRTVVPPELRAVIRQLEERIAQIEARRG